MGKVCCFICGLFDAFSDVVFGPIFLEMLDEHLNLDRVVCVDASSVRGCNEFLFSNGKLCVKVYHNPAMV